MAVHTIIIAENPQKSKFLAEMIRVGGFRGGSAPRGGTRRTCSASASGATPASRPAADSPDRGAAPDAAAADVGAAAGREQRDGGAVRAGRVDAGGQRGAAVGERFDYGTVQEDR